MRSADLVRFAVALLAILAMVAALAAVLMVAVVAMLALVVLVVGLVALLALILALFAPKVLRRVRSTAQEIGTRAGLTQAWIGYGWRIRTGQGPEQPSPHPDDDGSQFHDDLSPRRGAP